MYLCVNNKGKGLHPSSDPQIKKKIMKNFVIFLGVVLMLSAGFVAFGAVMLSGVLAVCLWLVAAICLCSGAFVLSQNERFEA